MPLNLMRAATLALAVVTAPAMANEEAVKAMEEYLDSQAGIALRIAGYDNLHILQGGFTEWKAKGGLDDAAKAAGQAKH